MERINLLPSLYLSGLLDSFDSQRTFATQKRNIKISEQTVDTQVSNSVNFHNIHTVPITPGLSVRLSEYDSIRVSSNAPWEKSKNLETNDGANSLRQDPAIN